MKPTTPLHVQKEKYRFAGAAVLTPSGEENTFTPTFRWETNFQARVGGLPTKRLSLPLPQEEAALVEEDYPYAVFAHCERVGALVWLKRLCLLVRGTVYALPYHPPKAPALPEAPSSVSDRQTERAPQPAAAYFAPGGDAPFWMPPTGEKSAVRRAGGSAIGSGSFAGSSAGPGGGVFVGNGSRLGSFENFGSFGSASRKRASLVSSGAAGSRPGSLSGSFSPGSAAGSFRFGSGFGLPSRRVSPCGSFTAKDITAKKSPADAPKSTEEISAPDWPEEFYENGAFYTADGREFIVFGYGLNLI